MAQARKDAKEKKDTFHAKAAFYLSLGFWVPLFNVAFCIMSIIIASKALKSHFRAPDRHGGLGFIITALVLSISSLIMTFVGLVLYFMSERICMSAVCTEYLVNG